MGAIGDGVLPTVVWPSDVVAYKRKLDPQWVSTDVVVRGCSGLSPAQQAAWSADYDAWRKFSNEDVPIFGSANKYDEAKAYEARLSGWQDVISGAGCQLAGPHVQAPPDGADAIKWIAGAAIVVSLVYGVRMVLR